VGGLVRQGLLIVHLGPLAPVDPDTGRDLVKVPEATDADLEWLARVDELSGRHAARYISGDPDAPDPVTGWITTETVRW